MIETLAKHDMRIRELERETAALYFIMLYICDKLELSEVKSLVERTMYNGNKAAGQAGTIAETT